MKRYILLMILLISLSMIGCNSEQKNEDIQVIKDELIINIKEGSVSNIDLTIVIENEDAYTYTFGQNEIIEKYENGKWKKLTSLKRTDINTIEYYVKPGKCIEYTINWENKYGSLANGKYRIKKLVNKISDTENSDERYYFYVEFEV